MARHNSIAPAHPGAILRDDVLPALGRPKTEIAALLGISRQALHNILAEKAPITPQMAVKMGKLCGNGPRIWLAMQVEHDLWKAEREVSTKGIPTLKAAA